MGQLMKPVDILHYIYVDHRIDWTTKDGKKIRHEHLLNDLNVTADKDSGVSMTAVSNLLRKGKASETLKKRLNETKLQQKIETRMGLEGLFECKSKEEVYQLLMHIRGRNSLPSPIEPENDKVRLQKRCCFETVDFTHSKGTMIELTKSELKAQDKVVQLICSGLAGSAHWNAVPWSGASYISYALHQRKEIRNCFSSIYLIRPSDPSAPYTAELRCLAEELGAYGSERNLTSDLARALRTKKILLIILDTCFTDIEKKSATDSIINFLKAAYGDHKKGQPVSVLTIGRSQILSNLQEKFWQRTGINEDLEKELVQGNTFEVFQTLFEAFKEHRSYTRHEEGGSRLKRSKWHYDRLVDKEAASEGTDLSIGRKVKRDVWPGMLRLRAYFASNLENHCYFDPTSGFEMLCGPSPRHKSIELLRDDLTAHLLRLVDGKSEKNLRSLRRCSTAKHWMTTSAIKALDLAFKSADEKDFKCNGYSTNPQSRSVIKLELDGFLKYLDEPDCPIRKLTTEFGEDAFTLGLGLKALVQEEWLASHPVARAVAHHRIAKRLWERQDDKQFLRSEFPYDPQWGRSRLFLLGECIRHLVCSIEGFPGEYEGEQVIKLESSEAFPLNEPLREYMGCNPSEVINYCFAVLYQREINSQANFSVETVKTVGYSRPLSKKHGAFEYAAELLQLMGKNRTIGEPHPALHPAFRVSYLRECGFALLDLGDLEGALRIFDRLEAESELGSREYYENELNRALALSEMNRLVEASEIVENVDAATRNTRLLEPEDIRPLKRRIGTRRVHLDYLNERFARVVENTRKQSSNNKSLRSLRLDEEIFMSRIRSLAQLDGSSTQAMKECMHILFRSTTDGFQHQALGYRVILGRLYRLRGELELSRQVLEDVQADILKYGCAERIYLEFLYEHGRTMQEEGDTLRAYASYLRPCLVRAQGRLFYRIAKIAYRHASNCLDQMVLQLQNSKEWAQTVDKASKNERKHISMDTKTYRDGLIDRDPLFGYYFADAVNVIEGLRSLKGIEAEREFLLNGEFARQMQTTGQD